METVEIQKNYQIVLQRLILNITEKIGWNLQFSRQIPNINLSQDQINGLNSPITPKQIEAIINNLATKKRPGPGNFCKEFFQIFKENPIPIHSQLFHKIETGRNNTKFDLWIQSFVNTKIMQRHNKERDLQTNFPYKHRCKYT